VYKSQSFYTVTCIKSITCVFDCHYRLSVDLHGEVAQGERAKLGYSPGTPRVLLLGGWRVVMKERDMLWVMGYDYDYGYKVMIVFMYIG
jgi:hypothetical protein